MARGLDPEDYLEVGDPDPTVVVNLKGYRFSIDLDLEESRQLMRLAERRRTDPVRLAKQLVLDGLARELASPVARQAK